MPLGLEYDTWYEYYDARPTSSVIKKGKMEQMMKSFDSTLSVNEAKAAMMKIKDIVSSAFSSSGSCLANENADEIMRVISSAFYKVVWQIKMLTRFT